MTETDLNLDTMVVVIWWISEIIHYYRIINTWDSSQCSNPEFYLYILNIVSCLFLLAREVYCISGPIPFIVWLICILYTRPSTLKRD